MEFEGRHRKVAAFAVPDVGLCLRWPPRIIDGMAKNTAKDPLEAAKIKGDGAPLDSGDPRAQAAEFLGRVQSDLPRGVPEDSPIAKLDRDAMLQLAATAQMPFGPLYTAEELRLVLHWGHLKLVSQPHISVGIGARPIAPSPPVPLQPPAPPAPGKRRPPGAPESQTGKWRVVNQTTKQISVGGQVCNLRPGSIIDQRHYNAGAVDSMADQGVELEALEPDEV
jgi:hypothetical protein